MQHSRWASSLPFLEHDLELTNEGKTKGISIICSHKSISEDTTPVAGRCGIKISPDCAIKDISEEDTYDLIFVPGGLEAAEAFAKSAAVGEIYTRHNNLGKLIAAICASPIALK